MRILSISILFSMGLLLVSGCDLLQEPEKRSGIIGTVHGIVTNANTNARLAGITIVLIKTGKQQTAVTDNHGFYSITNLPPGEYVISISNETNYAKTRTEAFVPTLAMIFPDINSLPDDEYHISTVADIELFSLDAGLTGTVFARQDAENISGASGATVIADFADYNISPDEYSTVTDANGLFTFALLPATPTVVLRTLPFDDGTSNYSVETAVVSLVSGGVTEDSDFLLSIAPATPFIVQNNYENDDLDVTDDIINTFSKAMDIETFQISMSSNSYGNVEFAAAWDNNITLTIDPYVPLQANERYYLELSGKSIDNNYFSDTSISFRTKAGIELVRTNLERVDGVFDQFPLSSNIELTFSMEIDLNNYNGHALLYDESFALVASSTSLSGDSKTLMINPLYNLEPGSEYYLDYRVYSSIEADYDQDFLDFRTASDYTTPEQVTGFTVDMGGTWTADWNTTFIQFKWNTVSNVDGYAIYAKDNYNNSDLIRVAEIGAFEGRSQQDGPVSLSGFPQFDYYQSDGIQTPFTNGTELSFQIAAFNETGLGAFSSTRIIGDRSAPTADSWVQSGTANNFSVTDILTFTISFSVNEYVDPDGISYLITNETGSNPYVLPSSAISFEWDADLRGGTFTISVPPSSDGSGDTLLITVLEDSSGNPAEIISWILQ